MTTQTLDVFIEYIDGHMAGARFNLNPNTLILRFMVSDFRAE